MSDTSPKKTYPNSGCLFRVSNDERKHEKSPEYSGVGEIDVTEAIPAGSKITFYVNAWVKTYTSRKTGVPGKFFSLRFNVKGRSAASSKAPTGIGTPAPTQVTPPTTETPSTDPTNAQDEPNFDY